MEILNAIVGKVAEKVVDSTVAPVARQVSYLISYKDNFKNLKDQVEDLQREKESLNREVVAEKRNGREIDDVVQNWLNRVDEISEAAMQLSDDPHHRNVGCSKWSFPDLKSRHQLSRKAKKMTGVVAEVIQGRNKFDRVAYLPALDGAGSTSGTRSSEKLESRKKMKEDIVLGLRDPNINRIGVYGLGGVGKTTLARDVAKRVKDEELFDEVVMANISQNADLERIQGEIADLLGLRFEEMTVVGRASRLRQRIKKEKSILIILDDFWETLDLDKLGIPPEDDHKGCKLLLTSRFHGVLQKMETQKDFNLDVLSEEEAWSLFEDIVGDRVVKDASFRSVAVQVAKKCAGLMVLIVTVARTLKNKDIGFWKDALNQLQTVDKEGMNGIIYSALEFSYNHLDGDEVKALFLLCGILGSQHDEYFLPCAMGLGIFKDINALKDARLRLHQLIDSLKASCLLLETNKYNIVTMHDIVREVAFSIASRDQHVFKIERGTELKAWPTEDFLQRCVYILLDWCHIHELPQRLECPKLEYFSLGDVNRSISLPDSFFEGMRNLKVLHLSDMHLPSLPKSFHSLINLQTLLIFECALEDMTNIGVLKNLQILCISGSSMIRLPEELGQLTLLKYLDLSNSGIETFPPNIISKLSKLEELYLGNTSTLWLLGNSVDQENQNGILTELKHLTDLSALKIEVPGAWVLPRDIMFEKLERYAIVIGDVWEWSDDDYYAASKMLKLKLGTSIHLEHGIKKLIKGVEDLYLDEIHGISNVLYHLNGEGFPLLKHLHIQNNGKILHIINSVDGTPSHVFFPNLQTLVLQNLSNLEKICHGSLTTHSFTRLRSIKVKCCNQLEYLFTISMVKYLCQLVEIEVLECSSMRKIVFVENSLPSPGAVDDDIEFYSLHSMTLQHLPSIDNFYYDELRSPTTTNQSFLGTGIPTFFNAKVKFSNLETLKLSSINLKKIWDDDHLSTANAIKKLANLYVEDCGGLKYLFSSSMIGSFPSLKHLEISKCDMMEEIIAARKSNKAASEEVRFSKLETMVIKNMKSLKKVWHFQFDGLKTLEVKDLEKLENIFPSDMQRTFGSLETLKVSDCSSMEVIFELTANEIQTEVDTTTHATQLKKLHLLGLPKLRQIWSRDPQGNFRFHNLQDVCVQYCGNIEYLFPFSIAVNLLQLEKLRVDSCGMTEIVAKREGTMEGQVIFQFDRLYTLIVWNMNKLDRFYAGNHSLLCPLRELDVRKCAKLKVFKTQGTSRQVRTSNTELRISTQQPFFTPQEVIRNLEELALSSEDASMISQEQFSREQLSKLKFVCFTNFEDDQAIFPYWFVQNTTSLERLVVEWSSFEEIFRDENLISEKRQIHIRSQLKRLTLHQLHELRHICKEGFRLDPVLEILEYLYVNQCSNLKQLVPSSVTFSHLTYLEVASCNGLNHLITSSTARSLVTLTTLKIRDCNSLEEVVVEEREKTEDEIAFSSLEVLKLECLPMVKRFCCSHCPLNLPLLMKLVVRQCPRIKSFSGTNTRAPMLRKILTDKEDEKWCWEGDLNRTVNKMFEDMVAFGSFNYLKLSEYPELKELWYGQVGKNIFCNLKCLVVHKCTFLSNVLFSSNLLQLLYTLEELEVTECNSLEAVFDAKLLDSKEKHPIAVSGLKKLTLSGLPNLKYIWKEDPRETLRFKNLQFVKVAKCQNLKSLFWVSLCYDLKQLEELDIEACGVEEIVAIEEGLEELQVDFPLLIKFRLALLTQIKDFYPGRYKLECPSLKILSVSHCEALHIFAFSHLDSQQLRVGDIDLSSQQSLFHIEKVSQSLEELSLNEKDALRIMNSNDDKSLFQSIETLRLQYFHRTPIIFLNDLLERFPSTTTLQMRYSSFETLFPSKEIGHIESFTQIKNLWLYQLEQLKHIWDDDCASNPLFQNLEDLYIGKCFGLKTLAPPSISFINLTTLEVKNCNGLTNLVTSFTAKSLVHLRSMRVKKCGMLEEIVMRDEEEFEEEIAFQTLEDLELTCLSSFKSFCSGKHTFIFPSLITLKVIECHKMQNFSSGIIIAPFLKKVEVKNQKKRWKEDLNTTIKQLFMDKAIGEGDEGNYKESSSDIEESNQKHEGTSSANEASSSEEEVGQSKAGWIVDNGKQGIHKLLIQHADESQGMEIHPTENPPTRSSVINDNKENIGTREMHETIQRPLVQPAQNNMTTPTSVQNTAIGTQETYGSIDELSVQAAQKALNPTIVNDTGENLFNQTTTVISADNKEIAENPEMYDTVEKPLVQTAQGTRGTSTILDKAIGTREMSGTNERFLVQNVVSPTNTMVHDTAIGTQETYETLERLWVQSSQNTMKLNTIQNAALRIQEIYETIERFLVQAGQITLSPDTIQDTEISHDSDTRTQEMPLAEARRNVLSSTMGHDPEKQHERETPSGENLLSQTANFVIAESRATTDHPAPSQASEAMSLSTLVVDAYVPYLEAGVKRHPQVLDWLNKEQQGVFASLFAEVTRILRTTRRGDLTEDDLNFIRKCCTALEVVGFDGDWLSYVYGCVEECEDGEDIKRKLEEAEDKAFALEKELASVKASLVLLRDKAGKLDSFIES